MDDFIPKITDIGHTLKSDICVWCGEKGELTESHLIPRILGGRYKPHITCKKCNGYFGRAIEADLKHNELFSAALINLGLIDEYNAYKNLKKTDINTGNEIHLRPNGKAIIAPRIKHDGTFIGPLDKGGERFLKQLSKKYPNLPSDDVEAFKNFLANPKGGIFRIADSEFRKDVFVSKPSTINVEMLATIDPGFIFKMVYEYASLNGILKVDPFRNFLRSFYKIDHANNAERICIDESVSVNMVSNINSTFGKIKNKRDIEFKDYHYFVLRLTDELTLYLEIVIFGQVRFMFIIATKWPQEFEFFNNEYDRCLILPISQNIVPLEMYPVLKFKQNYIHGNCLVNLRTRDLL